MEIWRENGEAKLAIDFLLDFAENEVELQIVFDFTNTVHDGGVVFDADLGGDFVGAEVEFFAEKEHSDLAGIFDVGDARFATHFFDGKVVVFRDAFDDLFGGDRAEFVGLIDGDRAVVDELKRGEAADFGHQEDSGEFAFEVTDVGVDIFSDVFDGFGFDFGAEKFGFGAENGALVFEFRELEIESASPGETRGKAFINGFNLGGKTVTGNDDLLV